MLPTNELEGTWSKTWKKFCERGHLHIYYLIYLSAWPRKMITKGTRQLEGVMDASAHNPLSQLHGLSSAVRVFFCFHFIEWLFRGGWAAPEKYFHPCSLFFFVSVHALRRSVAAAKLPWGSETRATKHSWNGNADGRTWAALSAGGNWYACKGHRVLLPLL